MWINTAVYQGRQASIKHGKRVYTNMHMIILCHTENTFNTYFIHVCVVNGEVI